MTEPPIVGLPLTGPRPAISEIDSAPLAAWLAARGEQPYRVDQVLSGAHRPETSSFDDFTDIPAALRAELALAFRFSTIVDSHVIGAEAGMTAKAVHELADGQRIESVLMRYAARGPMSERTTICISSQAGCAVNCPFCATGQAGFGRQLTPGEIVDQVLHWHHPPWNALGDAKAGHYNIVFMGMGEPLNNADGVFEAVRLLNDPERLGIGARHITVSTSGVVPGMDRMINELPQVNLAISLHAATDALRDELVPINRKWPIGEVMAAGRRFAGRTGRRVSLEYVMIDSLNDTLDQADGLVEIARGWRSHLNLIPLNPTPGSRWSGTSAAGIERFVRRLRAGGVSVTVRDTRGREIDAACGQLHAQLSGRSMREAREAAALVAPTP